MIRIESAGKHFDSSAGPFWVFRDLSLAIEPGESVVLVGPSGGGKSVLLKMIAGLLPCDEGKISLASSDVGMLFQRNALFDSLSVEENLLFPLRERLGISGPAARERSAQLLRAVGLSGCEALFPDELSGGMQKRLGIARALAVEPEVLLYDEPTAGLDPVTSRTIAELLRAMRSEEKASGKAEKMTRRSRTFLTVTNDMQRAYQLADRIFLLAQGRLLDCGSPERTRASEDPLVRQFIFGLREGPLGTTAGATDAGTN
jgi:phospholipid/cholesterol/gamma-HCH transport system ATP-binding protein